jgi:hypothetical protein
VTFFPMLKHHCSTLFISSHFHKHSSPPPHHSYSRNNSVQHLFRLSPSIAETPLAATFPLLKHQQPFIFLPLPKHRYQQPFISLPDAETPLFSIFHVFPPRHFPIIFYSRNNSVQHLFRRSPPLLKHLYQQPFIFLTISLPKQLRPAIVSPLFVAETPFASNPSSFIHDAETPPFSTP